VKPEETEALKGITPHSPFKQPVQV
jgi:hypothetical protein